MVKKVEKQGQKYFQCEECGFYYKTRGWAEKCGAFCKKHKSCSLKITKHAIKE